MAANFMKILKNNSKINNKTLNLIDKASNAAKDQTVTQNEKVEENMLDHIHEETTDEMLLKDKLEEPAVKPNLFAGLINKAQQK